MAHVSGKRHLRRISAPRTWPIPRKGSYWITRPTPVGISFDLCMPIILWVRDYLKLVNTRKELRYILSKGSIEINGKKIRDIGYPAGIFDTIRIVDLDKYYRVSVDDKGKLKLVEIPKEEYGKKIIKIVRKQYVKGGKIQVTGFDGRNFLFNENSIKTGDSLLVNLLENKIEKVVKMEPGNILFFYKGSKAGTFGRLKEIKILHRSFGHTRFLVYEDLSTKEVKETVADYGIVVGEEKPLITI